jgi:hypothetical protein
VLDRGLFTDFTLRSVFTASSRLAKVPPAAVVGNTVGDNTTSGELESTPR